MTPARRKRRPRRRKLIVRTKPSWPSTLRSFCSLMKLMTTSQTTSNAKKLTKRRSKKSTKSTKKITKKSRRSWNNKTTKNTTNNFTVWSRKRAHDRKPKKKNKQKKLTRFDDAWKCSRPLKTSPPKTERLLQQYYQDRVWPYPPLVI